MADITMCNGGNCPNKLTCYRFTATPNPYWQSYFVGYPDNKIDDNKVDCAMYWPNDEKVD